MAHTWETGVLIPKNPDPSLENRIDNFNPIPFLGHIWIVRARYLELWAPTQNWALGRSWDPSTQSMHKKPKKQKHKVGTPVKQNGSSRPCFAELWKGWKKQVAMVNISKCLAGNKAISMWAVTKTLCICCANGTILPRSHFMTFGCYIITCGC